MKIYIRCVRGVSKILPIRGIAVTSLEEPIYCLFVCLCARTLNREIREMFQKQKLRLRLAIYI
jgi:hypothetical protein